MRRRPGRLPPEVRHLAPVPMRRGRIEALVETPIALLDAMDDTDCDACEAEDTPPPARTRGPGGEEDAEPSCVAVARPHTHAPRPEAH